LPLAEEQAICTGESMLEDISRYFEPMLSKIWEDGSRINSLNRQEIDLLVDHITDLLKNHGDKINEQSHTKLLLILGDALVRKGKYAESVVHFERAKQLSEFLQDDYSRIKAVNGIAINYMVHGAFRQGIEAWESILDLIRDPKQKADMFNNLGIAYAMNDQYQKALEYHYGSLKIDEELKLEEEIGINYVNIANAQWKLKQFEKALDLYLKATAIFEKHGNQRYLSSSYGNIGSVYADLGDLEEALTYLNRSLELKKQYSNEHETALTIVRIGNIQRFMKKFDVALSLMNEALLTFEACHDSFTVAEILTTIGLTYFEMEDLNKSRKFTLKALKIASQNQNLAIQMKCHHLLYEIHSHKGQCKPALAQLEKHIEIYKKLFDANPKLMVAQSEVDYYRKKSEESIEFYRISNLELQDKNRIISQKSQQLNKVNIELEKNFSLLRKLVTIIAHDVRGPVSSISQALKMMQDKMFDQEEMDELLREIPKTADKTVAIVNDILLWIKRQQPRSRIELKPVFIHPLLEDTIQLYENMARMKEVTIWYNHIEDLMVISDESLLMTVFRNLLNNSIKFSAPKTRVDITVRFTARYCMIDFGDQGSGLSAEKIEALLSQHDPNSGRATSDITGGFGIALCLDFLAQTKGKLTIKSQAGKGSVFTVRLLRNLKPGN